MVHFTRSGLVRDEVKLVLTSVIGAPRGYQLPNRTCNFDFHNRSFCYVPKMAERFPPDRDPGRETPAQGAHISLAGPNFFFLTVNAKDRVPWIGQSNVHDSLREVWQAADKWLVGYYLLMPDHLHLFCAPRDLRFTIDGWLKYWKGQFSRQHLNESWEWQRNGFHHRIRNGREYQEKWTYVRENPVRKGLAKTCDEWPLQGTIHEMHW
jgi:putative transposase